MNLFEEGSKADAKLKQVNAITLLADALGDKLKAHFSYGSLVGDTLIFHFNHAGASFMFGQQKERIVERMREIYKANNLRGLLVFKKVESKAILIVKEKIEAEKEIELATGNFDIGDNVDIEIRRLFEQIRKSIQKNRGK